MKPEDVPAELVEKGMTAVGMWAKGPARAAQEADVRAALAAVLPEYGAQVLEEAAESFTEGGMVRRRLEDLARAARLTTTTKED